MGAGSGAGHIFDMINRLRANKNLTNRRRFAESRDRLIRLNGGEPLSFRECSEETLLQIRLDFEAEKKRLIRIRTIRLITSLAITAVILIAISFLLLFLLTNE